MAAPARPPAARSASEADAVIAYPDAGQISLHARYDLDATVAGFEMQGSSNAFVVRPFGFAFRGANAGTAIAHATTAAGAVLAAAGDTFTMTLGAYRWAAGQDADNDGVPDAGVTLTGNGLTPNYAAGTSVSATGNLPGIATGSIDRASGGSSVAALEWSGGAATVSDWRYSEVGNAFFGASAANYLGSGSSITGNSGLDGTGAAGGYVGRFRAKQLALSAATLANRAALLPCASTFSYMGESMRLTFTLTAQNTQNGTTQNYSGLYAKHDPSNALTAFAPGARSGTTNLTSRLSALYPGAVPAWSNGQLGVPVSDPIHIAVERASPDNPDGPRAGTQLGIAPTDSDGAALATFNLDVDNDTVNEHGAAGAAVELRYGRLALQNAAGPGTGALPIPVTAQYWNGSGFVTNTLDNCTALSRNQVELTGYVGALAPGPNCRTYLLQSPVTLVSGAATLQLAAPGSGVTGSLLLRPNLAATTTGAYCNNAAAPPTSPTAAAGMTYLLGRWDDAADPDTNPNTSYDDKPSARAVFGVFGSQPRNFIFQRENY